MTAPFRFMPCPNCCNCTNNAECYDPTDELEITLGDDWVSEDCANCDFSGTYILTWDAGLSKWRYVDEDMTCTCDWISTHFEIRAWVECVNGTHCRWTVLIGFWFTVGGGEAEIWLYRSTFAYPLPGTSWTLDIAGNSAYCYKGNVPCVVTTYPPTILLEAVV